MYSAKVLGNSSETVNINHSKHKAALKHAVKTKTAVPHTPKKK